MLVTPVDELRALTATATRAGIATQIHAIGDRAVRVALDTLEAAGGRALSLMPRVEHVQLLARGDEGRFAAAGIAASVQPVHLHSDAAGARRLWGERTAGAYAVRTLLDAGAVVAFGTDAPVESPDAWPGIALAVTRTDPAWGVDAGGPFHPEQAVTLAEAIRAACVGPGATAGDDRVGRLVPGSPADLVVLDAGVLRQPVAIGGALASARPLATLLDGTVVHRAASWDREPDVRLP
jgi:predicted amidohydrolase YtcJ